MTATLTSPLSLIAAEAEAGGRPVTAVQDAGFGRNAIETTCPSCPGTVTAWDGSDGNWYLACDRCDIDRAALVDALHFDRERAALEGVSGVTPPYPATP